VLATEIRYRISVSGLALKEFVTGEFNQMLYTFPEYNLGLMNSELPSDPKLLISVREWMLRRQLSQRTQ
jgi:hypothetical protein